MSPLLNFNLLHLEKEENPLNEKTRCEHCFAAWRLIQDRKEVRQKLGNAKRSLRQLGKSALKVTQ